MSICDPVQNLLCFNQNAQKRFNRFKCFAKGKFASNYFELCRAAERHGRHSEYLSGLQQCSNRRG